jgi:hypothetical protein
VEGLLVEVDEILAFARASLWAITDEDVDVVRHDCICYLNQREAGWRAVGEERHKPTLF